jgi:hypothetical protein
MSIPEVRAVRVMVVLENRQLLVWRKGRLALPMGEGEGEGFLDLRRVSAKLQPLTLVLSPRQGKRRNNGAN